MKIKSRKKIKKKYYMENGNLKKEYAIF